MTDERQHEVYGGFTTLVSDDPAWVIAGFDLPDGSRWEYREPDAVAVVQNGRLRVRATLSRRHDQVQILDNPKHMFFSSRRFDVPSSGGISFELTIRSSMTGTVPGDLYDGFVSFNLLDFSVGAALDWFVGHDRIAPVHARLPFPGVEAEDARPMKYFALFEELEHAPGAERRVSIAYDRARDRATWSLDGEQIWSAPVPVKLNSFIAALGIMTEKDLGPSGSISVHGQRITGEWSPLEIETWRS